MKKSLNKLIDKCFKEKRSNITIFDIEKVIKNFKTDILLVDALFYYANYALDKYTGNSNLKYVYKSLRFIKETITETTTQNQKQIEQLVFKINQMKEIDEDIFEENPSAKRVFKKINNLAVELYDDIIINSNTEYQILEYIINEMKNINYLKQIFNRMPNLVNSEDGMKNSIFYNTYRDVVNKIMKDAIDKENLDYYSDILKIMRSQEQFNLSSIQKKMCLNKLEQSLKNSDFSQTKKLKILSDLVLSDNENYVDINKLTSMYNINIGFNEQLVEELNLYQTPTSKENYPDRLIVDDYIITIDGHNTIEIDDALSIKTMANGNYLLGVHIASPLGYLPFESLNIQEAIKRGSTIYLPKGIQHSSDTFKDGFIPIFHESFSTNQASLIEGVPRLARSHFFEIDKSGYVVNQKYMKTIIKNNNRCTYDEVDNIIKFGSNDLKLSQTINLLDELTYSLEHTYKIKKIYLEKKLQSSDPAQVKMNGSRAEKIVSTSMILTGSNVADFFANSKEGFPTLYRVHEVNKDEHLKLEQELKKISNNREKDKFSKLHQSIIQTYPAATYDIQGSHHGLNLKHHCHCTSSLRRSADIIVDHSLDVCYFNNPTDIELKDLENIILTSRDIINNQNKQIDLFLNDYNKQIRKTKTVK